MLDPKSLSVLAKDLAEVAAHAKVTLVCLRCETARALAYLMRCADRDLKRALDARCEGRVDKGAEVRLRGSVGAAKALLATSAKSG